MGVAEEETGDRRGDESGRKESITAWHAAACQPFDLTKPRSDHRNYLNPRVHSLLTVRERERVWLASAQISSHCAQPQSITRPLSTMSNGGARRGPFRTLAPVAVFLTTINHALMILPFIN